MLQNRRDENTMLELILEIAQQDERVRAVIMNGSRASPSAKKDIFQDYDIVYIVTDVESYVNDPQWIDRFGERLIMQTPDEMDGKWPKSKDEFAYLIQFKDWNRIDLTLLHRKKVPLMIKDSQSILLLDKDNLLGKFEPHSDQDYLPTPPTETEFKNACNEFLWVSTYVAKGIWRKELTYAKAMAEQVVKEELLKLLGWHAGIKTEFKKPLGKNSKYLESYLEPEIWDCFKKTYVDAEYAHVWDGLFTMCDLFHDIASKISKQYGFDYNSQEYLEVLAYLKDVKQSTASCTIIPQI